MASATPSIRRTSCSMMGDIPQLSAARRGRRTRRATRWSRSPPAMVGDAQCRARHDRRRLLDGRDAPARLRLRDCRARRRARARCRPRRGTNRQTNAPSAMHDRSTGRERRDASIRQTLVTMTEPAATAPDKHRGRRATTTDRTTLPVPPLQHGTDDRALPAARLLAATRSMYSIARRATLRRTLAEMRQEWHKALADPPHLVATIACPSSRRPSRPHHGLVTLGGDGRPCAEGRSMWRAPTPCRRCGKRRAAINGGAAGIPARGRARSQTRVGQDRRLLGTPAHQLRRPRDRDDRGGPSRHRPLDAHRRHPRPPTPPRPPRDRGPPQPAPRATRRSRFSQRS